MFNFFKSVKDRIEKGAAEWDKRMEEREVTIAYRDKILDGAYHDIAVENFDLESLPEDEALRLIEEMMKDSKLQTPEKLDKASKFIKGVLKD